MVKDTIYREDAIKAISQWLDNEDDLFNIGLKQAVYEIKRVPSADTFEITKEALIEAIDNAETVGDVVENIIDRPRGEWIVNTRNYKSVCSVCGANETDFIYGTERWYGLGESKFCPNCGARMTTYSLAVALAKLLEEEGVTDEELEQIIHDAKEEARKEIARMKGADDEVQ